MAKSSQAAGAVIALQANPTPVVMYGRTRRPGAAKWTHLQGGTEHSLQGLEDSALLMTILFAPA